MIIKKIDFPGIKYNIIAGFTNRLCGISKPPFQSLNLGRFTDDPHVESNYSILNSHLGSSSLDWCWLKQVHGNHIIHTDKPGFNGEGDGLFTTQSGLFLAVQTADCIPLIFAHQTQPYIAVLHAGWKGLHKNIITQFLTISKSNGLSPEDFMVAIGPHLKQCHFAVTEEFLHFFEEKYFSQKNRKYHFESSLNAYDQLLQNGIPEKNISNSPNCTYCEQDYFSYRNDGKTGRQIGFIGIC